MRITRILAVLACSTLSLLAACGGGGSDTVTDAPQPDGGSKPLGNASLRTSYADAFLIGAAIKPEHLQSADTAALITSQFNVIVAENAMKPASLSPSEGVYDFTEADRIVAFAAERGIKVRGHTLVWHAQTAPWMFADNPTKEIVLARMKRYIADVVGHFKGKVYAWDVVNEALIGNGDGSPQFGTTGWRDSNWFKAFGGTEAGALEYIAEAFKAAHAADPDALLFYNDYSTEDSRKSALILQLVRNLQAQGVPIHGIGHQAHYRIGYPQSWTALDKLIGDVHALGLTNHITELDIGLNTSYSGATVTAPFSASLLAAQAAQYRSLFEMLLANRDKVSAALVWGLRDSESWLAYVPLRRVEGPLLFDDQLQPKPAYWALLDALTTAQPSPTPGPTPGADATRLNWEGTQVSDWANSLYADDASMVESGSQNIAFAKGSEAYQGSASLQITGDTRPVKYGAGEYVSTFRIKLDAAGSLIEDFSSKTVTAHYKVPAGVSKLMMIVNDTAYHPCRGKAIDVAPDAGGWTTVSFKPGDASQIGDYCDPAFDITKVTYLEVRAITSATASSRITWYLDSIDW